MPQMLEFFCSIRIFMYMFSALERCKDDHTTGLNKMEKDIIETDVCDSLKQIDDSLSLLTCSSLNNIRCNRLLLDV